MPHIPPVSVLGFHVALQRIGGWQSIRMEVSVCFRDGDCREQPEVARFVAGARRESTFKRAGIRHVIFAKSKPWCLAAVAASGINCPSRRHECTHCRVKSPRQVVSPDLC